MHNLDINNYFVYCLFDITRPVKIENDLLSVCFLFEPFYIGKGKGKRIKSHFYPSNLRSKNAKNNKIKRILNEGYSVLSDVLINDLEENEAYHFEEKIINSIGRRDTGRGSLTNLCDGGYGIKNCKMPSKCKTVFQFNLLGQFIKEYSSITEAAQMTNLQISDISKCCLGKARTHGGFFWSFENKVELIRNKKNKNVLQYDLFGNLIREYSSITEASIATGINHSIIIRICNDQLLSKNQFYFRYKDQIFNHRCKKKTNKKVLQLTDKDIIMFESVKEAAKILELTVKSVISRCKNEYVYDNLYLIYEEDYKKGKLKKIAKKGNNEKPIYKIDDRNQIVEVFDSVSHASRVEKLSRSHLSRNLDKKKIKGYLYATICNRRVD